MNRCLVVVSGLPGSGKSTLARQLAAALGLPVLDKYDILERLFGVKGVGDVEWRRSLSRESDRILEEEAARSEGAVLVSHWRLPGMPENSGTPTGWLGDVLGDGGACPLCMPGRIGGGAIYPKKAPLRSSRRAEIGGGDIGSDSRSCQLRGIDDRAASRRGHVTGSSVGSSIARGSRALRRCCAANFRDALNQRRLMNTYDIKVVLGPDESGARKTGRVYLGRHRGRSAARCRERLRMLVESDEDLKSLKLLR